jgi:Tectonin domain
MKLNVVLCCVAGLIAASTANANAEVCHGVRVGSKGAAFATMNGPNNSGYPTLIGLSPDKEAVYMGDGYSGSYSWSRIGNAASRIFAGGDNLFALSSNGSAVYGFDRTTKNWGWVGGPGADFVVTDTGTLYGISPNNSGVYRLNSNKTWSKVGSGISKLYAGGDKVFGLGTDANIYKLPANPSATAPWPRVGGRGAMFAVDANGVLYGLSPTRGDVYRYNGYGTSWKWIGGAAGAIYGGADTLIATNPSNTQIYEYDDYFAGDWALLSNCSVKEVFAGSGWVFAVDRVNGDVWRMYGNLEGDTAYNPATK